MRQLTAKRLAIITLGLAGALLIPSNGSADYYPWGGWYGSSYYTGYFPSYTSYYPNYWDGYYGGPYTVGYYGSGCCGSCGPSCGIGCGSCGFGCGSCGTSCGSCGIGCGSCGSGCCGTSFGCGSCGCGVSGCGGLACGSGTATGSDCGGSPSPPAKPRAKKAQPDPNDNFEPRPSPTYQDDTPPPRKGKKAPSTSPPDLGTGAPGPPGGTSIEGGDPQANPAKASPGDFKPPTSGATKSQGDQDQPFNTKKPVGPPPDNSGKKAPIKNGPDVDASDEFQNRSMASGGALDSKLTNNPALHLQERVTWSYTGIERPTVARIASTTSPIPRRVKSPTIEWAPATVVAKVVRN